MEKTNSSLARKVHDFVTESFTPRFGQLKEKFPQNSLWARLHDMGTRLWLDTGNIEDSQKRWTREFSALTTNNTLLNREIQTGQYDSLVKAAAELLEDSGLSDEQKMLEIAFILNASHGLRLVEQFDSYVSVEEHTALAHDVELATEYARRYHAICPQRFIVKIPFTPAGLLATRRVAAEGIPINHTLGFSARQNYLIARIGKPAFVNVFLGRLNSFVISNNLGNGSYIGEKATLASQTAVRKLRNANQSPSRQIGASFREGGQVRDLAGLDVMTIPPKVTDEFLALNLEPDQVTDRTAADYTPGINDSTDPKAVRLDTLWDIGDELLGCVEALEKENIDAFTADDLVGFFHQHGCGDMMVRWTDQQIAASTTEGKIPKLENWKDALTQKSIGLDSLMNLAGLNSFTTDQKAMDDRVRSVLAK